MAQHSDIEDADQPPFGHFWEDLQLQNIDRPFDTFEQALKYLSLQPPPPPGYWAPASAPEPEPPPPKAATRLRKRGGRRRRERVAAKAASSTDVVSPTPPPRRWADFSSTDDDENGNHQANVQHLSSEDLASRQLGVTAADVDYESWAGSSAYGEHAPMSSPAASHGQQFAEQVMKRSPDEEQSGQQELDPYTDLDDDHDGMFWPRATQYDMELEQRRHEEYWESEVAPLLRYTRGLLEEVKAFTQ